MAGDMKSLWTYLPKDNTVQTDGVLGTAAVPGAYDKYAGRAKSRDIEKIKEWLEKTAPGRSNSVSVLTKPISDDSPEKIRKWREHRTEVELPSYQELLKKKFVSALYKTRKGRGLDKVEDTEEQDYGEPGQFLFSNTPHYILSLTGRNIPVEEIRNIDGKKTASDNTLDEAIRRIKSHIVVNKGLDPDDVAQRVLQLHMSRIFQHIFMVKAFASMIAAKHANAKWVPKLRENVLKHDQHKWNDVEYMGDYAPYIVEEYVGSKWFHTNDGYDKVHERVGRIHRTKSEHHVDHWCPFLKDSERKNEPLVPLLMPDYAMAEMCADWMAVSMEKGGTATEWFHRNQGKEWRFTKSQQAFIESILKDEPEFRRRFKAA